MRRFLRSPLVLVPLLFNLLLLVWLGLRQKPQPFAPFAPAPAEPPAPADWPDDLPAPVRRAFEAVLGERPRHITSAVVSGRATLRIGGIPLRGRFRFIHDAGHSYRHQIEVTWFGRPVLRVDESFIDGYAHMDLGPMGVTEGTPELFQAATLGMWAEAIWFPSVLVTDPRLRWVAVDSTHARLYVPAGDREETLLFTFDPLTGRIAAIDALRYRDANAGAQMLGWHCVADAYARYGGVKVPTESSVQWSDASYAWAEWTVEDVVYNVDVSEALRPVHR
jgi:hypothetical protein